MRPNKSSLLGERAYFVGKRQADSLPPWQNHRPDAMRVYATPYPIGPMRCIRCAGSYALRSTRYAPHIPRF